MHAAHHKHHEVAKLLADRGADVSLRAKNGSNAFDIAHLTREYSAYCIVLHKVQKCVCLLPYWSKNLHKKDLYCSVFVFTCICAPCPRVEVRTLVCHAMISLSKRIRVG